MPLLCNGLVVNDPDKDIVARIPYPLCSVLEGGTNTVLIRRQKTIFTLIKRLSSNK